MNFDKLKNLFTRSVSTNDEQSLLQRAASIITSSRRTTIQNPTAQFQTYLSGLPTEELKTFKSAKPRPSRTASLRPQMVVRCYQLVPALYFDPAYAIKDDFFTRNHKDVKQKTARMHEYLDEVEVCLFNQISSRFDEILSVLRTIESLECVVTFNSSRLREVRQNNVLIARSASERHLKIVRLLRRQQRLKGVLSKLSQLKIYSSFISIQAGDLKLQRTNSQRYNQINQIRMRRELYFELNAAKNFEERVQQFQFALKKSYSDSINDAFFKYAVEVFPYDPGFWEHKFAGRVIFEEEQPDVDGTVILDESVLGEEEGGYKVRVGEQRQGEIVANLVGGWREGEYSTGSIKAAFDKFVKERHLRFCSDCRNFCFQWYLREERKKIQNPNLLNLMQQMNIFFCAKTFVYYADMYRSLLTRCFSLVARMIASMLEVSCGQLNIEEKEKLVAVVDGLFSILCFVFKAVYEKVIETVQLKHVHDSMQLGDFKQVINVLETEEEFIGKHLRRFMEFRGRGSFLEGVVAGCQAKLDFDMVRRAKEEKVLSFLTRTHRYILENQLRDSFQNEIWMATDIPTFYYDSLHFLITGQSLNLRRNRNHTIRHNASNNFESSVFIDRMGSSVLMENNFMGNFRIIRSEIIIDNKVYKVTETLLLLLEIIEDYMHLAQFYPFAGQEVGVKIYELLRAYNTSSNQLIILGGAVKLQKIKTKNITAKHLALNSLCLAFLIYVIKCIRGRVPIFQQQKILVELQTHQENTIKKLSNILSGKVSQALADINLNAVPSKGTEAIVNSTKILHDILVDYYQKDVLSRIFGRENVMAYLNKLRAIKVGSKMEAESLKDDMSFYFHELAFLEGLVGDYQKLRIEGEDIVRVKFEEL